MNDKDFDDIGKRLYDLEADPPKNGWARISPVLNTPTPSGKVIWMRKNWWKPLVLLIPAVSLYIMHAGQNVESPKLPSARSTESSIVDRSFKAQAETPSANGGANDFNVRQPSTGKQEMKNAIAGLAREETPVKSKALLSEPLTGNVSQQNSNISSYIRKKDEEEKMQATGSTSVKASTTLPVRIVSGERRSAHDEILAPIQYAPVDPVSQDMDTASILRSQSKPLVQEPQTTADTASSESLAKINEAKQDGQWRLTVSFTPQHVVKAVRPIANDEVLMTGIDNARYPQKIGFGFAVGAGKAITPDFYIDGQLSFMEMQQDIYFSYATGKVDTLLAVQQTDQTVRVKPVYHVDHREITSKYGYGGVRLGGTYYFWSTPRRRFNIAATAGVNYLVSARVKEKINGQWVSLNDGNFNKVNYNFMVAAGYNLNLTKGWELLVNPALTYFLRDVKNEELPYKLNQRSFGLVIMLSKSFERQR